ncbi:hypothetical protein AMAG_09896 [Allomyces macrogynus ATCC 38327]|uniref:Uncharacterized protein n=1 Tax=Allomyces macrogynus (strain ATCC 38327) TaxID=578462 RepID=A0A0L0SPW4_ALLM3|nr:hypothetical protein AMAG_09896 [Allomyces macrogynus ATCC 38327]|eukprot:KNE64536.1 hypothetical protein AMAG_09896 [Allomyces macrogynus ATCC 38327]
MSSTAPAPATAPTAQHGAAPGKRIRVNFMNIRECADMLSFNPKLSIQDNLNCKVRDKLNEIPNLHRVISMNYTDTSSMLKKSMSNS